MKKLILMVAIAGFAFAAIAQTTKKESKKEKVKTEKMVMKDHICTAACKSCPACKKGSTADCKSCTHAYTHGEKRHKCGDECKKMMGSTTQTGSTMALKDHVCTDACSKAGKCVIAHGEKGHVCGEECQKMMK